MSGFGKRAAPPQPGEAKLAPRPAPTLVAPTASPAPAAASPAPAAAPPPPPAAPPVQSEAETRFVEIKISVFNTLLQTVDLKEIGKLKPEAVRAELSDVISEIVAIKNYVLNSQEQARL